jgi:hypothetical protein
MDRAPSERSAYIGWWAAAIVLLATFAAAAFVWLTFHPL